jgi:hypothetical protein
MRRRSVTGPLILLIVGVLFLWRNLHPEAQIFDAVALYWPLLLIAWGIIRAIEVLFWRREGYRTGLSGGEVVLIVFICVVGMGMASASHSGFRMGFLRSFGQNMWGQQFDYTINVKAPASGIKRVVIENSRGDIKITGADVQEVQVSGRKLVRAYTQADADKIDKATPVEIVAEGDRLVVRTNQDRARENQRMSDDLEITVPRGVALEGRSTYGDYEVEDIAANVEITSGNADVRLARVGGSAKLDIDRSSIIRASDLKGDLALRGDGSDLDLENIGGQVTVSGAFRGTLDFKSLAKPLQFDGSRDTELSVQAVPGHISMDLGEFTGVNLVGPVRLVAHSRDVRIEQFTQSLVVETRRGDVELSPGRAPLPSMDVRTGTGRIDLQLPPDASFNLEATAQAGDAVNDYGSSIRKQVSGRSATLTGKAGNGPTVRLTAERGWISVRKEGSAAPEAPGRVPEPPEPPIPPTPPHSKGSQI